jgi:transposase
VYYALAELDFEEVMVINPSHAKALKGHKTDARDAIRLLDLYECGLLPGSCIPAPDLREVRDLARYRMKTVQARASEIQRLQKTLETAGIKLSSVVSDVTGVSAMAMVEALIDGERRGAVLADLAVGRMRTRQKMADLSMALAGRFTSHRAVMCRLHLDRIRLFDEAVTDLGARIAPRVARYAREAELLKTIPGFGDVVVAGWLGSIGPAPHEYFATAQRLASWATLCPGNYMSAKKSKGGRTGDGGAYIKPLLAQAAWAAVRVPGRIQARFNRLVRRFGGARNKGAAKRAIIAIARTLLKIAYHVLKTGAPYRDLGTDYYASRESAQARQDYLIRQLQQLNPGCAITITPGRQPDDPGLTRTPSPGSAQPTALQPTTQTVAGCCRAPRKHPISCQSPCRSSGHYFRGWFECHRGFSGYGSRARACQHGQSIYLSLLMAHTCHGETGESSS